MTMTRTDETIEKTDACTPQVADAQPSTSSREKLLKRINSKIAFLKAVSIRAIPVIESERLSPDEINKLKLEIETANIFLSTNEAAKKIVDALPNDLTELSDATLTNHYSQIKSDIAVLTAAEENALKNIVSALFPEKIAETPSTKTIVPQKRNLRHASLRVAEPKPKPTLPIPTVAAIKPATDSIADTAISASTPPEEPTSAKTKLQQALGSSAKTVQDMFGTIKAATPNFALVSANANGFFANPANKPSPEDEEATRKEATEKAAKKEAAEKAARERARTRVVGKGTMFFDPDAETSNATTPNSARKRTVKK